MKFHPYFYEAPDGVHYPDAVAGASYFYGVDFSNYLQSQVGTLKSVTWQLEDGLIGYDEAVDEDNPSLYYKKIESPYVGTYTVTIVGVYESQEVEQSIPVRLLIKVL